MTIINNALERIKSAERTLGTSLGEIEDAIGELSAVLTRIMSARDRARRLLRKTKGSDADDVLLVSTVRLSMADVLADRLSGSAAVEVVRRKMSDYEYN